MAELERLYGSESTRWFSNESATIDSDNFDFDRLGGSVKSGRVLSELKGTWQDASREIIAHFGPLWAEAGHKITLGISAYGFTASAREVQKTGIVLKQQLKSHRVTLRLIPNDFPALNTATSHHNKLGLSANKVELLVVRSGSGSIIIAESVGAQNITAFAARDQARPHTDAFVGMLPPKLARLMVNLSNIEPSSTLLDPFCGTGVILQEALLDGCRVSGTDLSDKMVDYTIQNLDWLSKKFHVDGSILEISQGDAMSYHWAQANALDAVVCETYLGQPFSAPPKPEKLAAVRDNCNHIITQFLDNLASQIAPSTPVILAVPAWRDSHGNFTHLPFIRDISRYGFRRISLEHVRDDQLLYFRETQVVARELLILEKS
jgi:tRNA (guanine10-N2)-dimethyltransferase